MRFTLGKNYYKIFNINPSATPDEVEKAYHQLVQKHPDKNPGDAKFKLILEAYEVLSNLQKRSKYDFFLFRYDLDVKHNQFLKNYPKSPSTPQQPSAHSTQYVETLKAVFNFTCQEEIKQRPNLRMSQLGLNQDKQTEFWQIHQAFSQNQSHFLQNKYSIETLKSLVYVFDDISLSHLDEECRNDPDVVDAYISNHGLTGLAHASKNAIMQLLDYQDSALHRMLTRADPTLFSSGWDREFFKYYPYEIDSSLFIKLMLINPFFIQSFPKEKILACLRDPQCRQYKEVILVDMLYENNNTISKDLEILIEIYQHYDRNILRKFDDSDWYSGFIGYSGQRAELINRVRQLFIKYPNDIDLKDIISIKGLIDQQSLSFNYDAAQETLTCTGKLFDVDGSQPTFSKTNQIMAQNAWRSNQTFIHVLAENLEPTIFCKMLASIPREKRAVYLFSPDTSHTNAYQIYDFACGMKGTADQKKEHLDALAELIYPAKPINANDLANVKQEVCALLNDYRSRWKLSIFNHHHEARAKHVQKVISKADSLAEIGLILENQLALLENKVKEPLFKAQNEQFIIKKIFANQSISEGLLARWWKSSPKNLPPQKNPMDSGYYRALKLANDVVNKYNNSKEKQDDSSLKP